MPINSSLSATIDQGSMCACTQIIASKSFEKDQIFLNHREESISTNSRLSNVIAALRNRSEDWVDENGKVLIAKDQWKDYKLRIVSVNNFPTAAGLASSAAGYACFTFVLSTLFNFQPKYPGELSTIARQGSGSACRSMYGGYVKWIKGEKEDGSDSIAEQVAPHTAWPEMRVIILVANKAQKETSSTDGMKRSVETSELLAYRAEKIVPKRMQQMEQYIKNKDFEGFGRLTMEDSNQFHATCLDTYPPIFYLNETSKNVIACCDAINKYLNRIVAAYTFDAGPNAVIYCLEADLENLVNLFLQQFLTAEYNPSTFILDPTHCSPQSSSSSHQLKEDLAPIHSKFPTKTSAHQVHQIILSRVGGGPQLIKKEDSFSTKQ